MGDEFDSTEICEALIRHLEVIGSEVFEKNYVKGGKIIASIWCIIGENAEEFNRMVKHWLSDKGFKLDGINE